MIGPPSTLAKSRSFKIGVTADHFALNCAVRLWASDLARVRAGFRNKDERLIYGAPIANHPDISENLHSAVVGTLPLVLLPI
jgi:hypothetical protein